MMLRVIFISALVIIALLIVFGFAVKVLDVSGDDVALLDISSGREIKRVEMPGTVEHVLPVGQTG